MRALAILGLCIGAAIVCADVFICMVSFTLSPDDAAYDAPPFAILTDPFFLSGAIVVGGFIGIIAFLFVFFTIRRLRLLASAALIIGIVLVEIVVVTPFDRFVGFVGSVFAFGLALCVLRFSGAPLFHGPAGGQSSDGHPPQGTP